MNDRAIILEGVDDLNGAFPGYGTAAIEILHAVDVCDRFQDAIGGGARIGLKNLERAVIAFQGIQRIAKRTDDFVKVARWQDTVPETIELANEARVHCATLFELMPKLRTLGN